MRDKKKNSPLHCCFLFLFALALCFNSYFFSSYGDIGEEEATPPSQSAHAAATGANPPIRAAGLSPNTQPASGQPLLTQPAARRAWSGASHSLDGVSWSVLPDDGISSQFEEVEWVRGIQRRRKAGLEPDDVDPYADLSDDIFRLVSIRNESIRSSIAVVPHDVSRFRWRNDAASGRAASRELHFVHVPKCGGTSVTKVLRRMACVLNGGEPSKNAKGARQWEASGKLQLDCCSPPGFCGAPEKRTCKLIKGCVNHFPNLDFVNPHQRPSLTILRSSITRVISSWHYRCHNPNFDCFKVRPNLRTWKMHMRGESEPPGVRNYTFDEFLRMPEYHNIATRMFSRDAMPYGGHRGGLLKRDGTGIDSSRIFPRDPRPRDAVIGAEDLAKAQATLEKFRWVGLMELMGTSLLVLSVHLGVPLEREDLVRQRASHTPSYHAFAKALQGNVHAGGTISAAHLASTRSSLATSPLYKMRRAVPINLWASSEARYGAQETASQEHAAVPSSSSSRLAKIIAANAYDAVLWDDTRSRLCYELRRLGIDDNPIVRRDVEMSRLPSCTSI